MITSAAPTPLLQGRDLLSIGNFSKLELEHVLATAKLLQEEPRPDLCKGTILAACFFEPSTRTRLSFEAAMHRLGGAVIGFAEPTTTSMKKGESLSDAIRVISSYADLLVIRHPLEGSARLAAENSDKPVINAGDGANQHPTQTLVDLFTIQETQGRIDELHIALAGDLRFGRAIHSLVLALSHYSVRLYFISPEHLSLPSDISDALKQKGIKFSFHSAIGDVIPKIDVLYMTRIQKERFDPGSAFHNPALLKQADLAHAKPNLRVLHPLPRIDEIERSIDSSPFAAYFQQAAGGIPIRMALLALLLGKA